MGTGIKDKNRYEKYKIVCLMVFQLLLVYSCKYTKTNRIEFNEKGVYGAFFNDKYNRIFAGNGRGELFTLDYDLNVLSAHQLAYGPVATSICSSDNEYMVNTSGDGVLYVWEVLPDSLSLVYKEKLHDAPSMTCLFSPEMNYVVSTGHDSAVVVIDWQQKKILQRLKSAYGAIRFAWFSYDDKRLYWADEKGYLYVTRTDNWNTIKKRISKDAINCLTSNLDDTEMVLSDFKGKIWVVKLPELSVIQVLDAHDGAAFVAEYYDVEKTKVASTGNDGYINIWYKENGKYKKIKSVKAHNSPCCTLFYNDSGDRLLSGGQDGWIRVWDAKTLSLIKEVNVNSK